VVALVFVAAIAAGGAYAALVRYDLVGLGHLPRVAVFSLFLLLLFNAAWYRLFRQRPFSTAQLGFFYVAILVMAGFPGQQLVTYFYLGLIGTQYYASPENRFAENILVHVPKWLVPSKDAASPIIKWAFEGMPQGAHVPWGAWVTPILAWTPVLIALLVLQLCLAALLRRRWVEHDRLTFPLARIPAELMSYDSPRASWPSVFRRWAFWIPFMIPVTLTSLAALHQYYPAMPQIAINRDIGPAFPTRPWNELNYLQYTLYFGVIGVTALIPSDIGFSLWFFWLLRRFVQVARSAVGLVGQGGFFDQHGIGAFVVLAIIYLWMARHTLISAAREVFSRHPPADEDEPIAHRVALVGTLAAIAVILVWVRIVGAKMAVAVPMLALYIAGIVVVTRLVSESGILVVWTPIGAPQVPVIHALGPAEAGARTVVASSYFGWKVQDSASCTMASIMQGYRLGDFVRARPRALFWLATASLIVALFASHPAAIKVIYAFGVPKLGWWPSGAAWGVPGTADSLLRLTRTYRLGEYGNMLSGGAVVLFLQAMRMRFTSFPFHPLAYAFAAGPSWASNRYGFSIFLGWLMKWVAIRWAGRRGFDRLRVIAMGIIVGDAAVLSLWTALRYFFPHGEALIIE
jgi:hypothetical protein